MSDAPGEARWREALISLLEEDEGVRPFPYTDTVGKLTIGVGRNLSDRGLSLDEIDFLLENDIDLVLSELDRILPWWRSLDDTRKLVLASMCFQLGAARLLKFTNTLAAIRRGDFSAAARGMKESKWYRQTPNRAARLIEMMKQQPDPDETGGAPAHLLEEK